MFRIEEKVDRNKQILHFYQYNAEVYKARGSIAELYEMLLSRTSSKYEIYYEKNNMKSIITESERLFKQCVVYTAVKQTLRQATHLRLVSLASIILNMDEFSLHYWFVEVTSRYVRGEDTRRVGKAFAILFGDPYAK